MRNTGPATRGEGGPGSELPSPAHLLPTARNVLDHGLLCRGVYPSGVALSVLAFQRGVISCGGQGWNPDLGLQRPHSLPTSGGTGSWHLAAVVRGPWLGGPTPPCRCLQSQHICGCLGWRSQYCWWFVPCLSTVGPVAQVSYRPCLRGVATGARTGPVMCPLTS